MVIFDGEYFIVQVQRGKDNDKLIDIAKEWNGEFIPKANMFLFQPTKHIARLIASCGYAFDKSALKFFSLSHTSELTGTPRTYNLPKGLYQFQEEGITKMLGMKSNILLADEMGLGKSVQASVYLDLKENSIPALVVCPASLKLNWQREIEKWTKHKAYVISGIKPEHFSNEFVRKYPVWIINYDILGKENAEQKEYEKQRKLECKISGEKYKKRNPEVEGWCDEIINHNFRTILADEIQYISDPDTIRARCLIKICKTLYNSKKLFMSGTPYETKTSQFHTCLSLLAPNEFGNRWQFLMRYCDAKKTFFGWKFEGLSNGEELHNRISKFMIRRLKKDVLTQLPPKIRSVIPLEISKSDRQKYEEADRELEKAVQNKETNALSKLAELKQVCFEIKKDYAIKWIKDYLEFNSKKLVVFIHHHRAYDALMEEFSYCAVGVTGDTPIKKRQEYVDKFQDDKQTFLFIGNIQACGTGLTLTASSATCFLEFGKTASSHSQAEDRVHRISQKADSVMAYYLIADNTIEEQIMSVLNKRNENIKKVMDNENNSIMFEKEDDFDKDILAEYKKTKNIN